MRLLIVEDDEKLAAALKKGLEGRGFAVDWIDDGEKAYKRILLYRKDYDLIILDLMLPGMGGADIAKNARKEGVSTPIIVLTSRHELDQKVDLLYGGADDYVEKPFSFDELAARINSVMRRPVLSQPAVLKVGPIEMDTGTRAVRKNGKPISLTLKEFSILECFMREPNKVLSRENLIDHVWDFNSLSLSNVLDVHMKNIRKKLHDGEDGDRFFQTVRGVGYKMAEPNRDMSFAMEKFA